MHDYYYYALLLFLGGWIWIVGIMGEGLLGEFQCSDVEEFLKYKLLQNNKDAVLWLELAE